jgi:hypothetical protein
MLTTVYVLETRYKTIIPVLPASDEIIPWAREYPNMYNVYGTGYLTYYNQQALDWFILRWGPGSLGAVSPVGLG